jgi:hypothetical protein
MIGPRAEPARPGDRRSLPSDAGSVTDPRQRATSPRSATSTHDAGRCPTFAPSIVAVPASAGGGQGLKRRRPAPAAAQVDDAVRKGDTDHRATDRDMHADRGPIPSLLRHGGGAPPPRSDREAAHAGRPDRRDAAMPAKVHHFAPADRLRRRRRSTPTWPSNSLEDLIADGRADLGIDRRRPCSNYIKAVGQGRARR